MTRWIRLICILSALASTTFAQPDRDQILQSPFQSGVTHAEGKYGFTQDNFLIEGANRVRDLGSGAIFFYMDPAFRTRYPDKSNAPSWPAGNPATLTELAQTAPFQAVLDMPFKTFVITAFSFANMDNVADFSVNPDAAAFEEQEFYDLAKYLYMRYAGTNKIFILKHWEGDYVGLRGFDITKSIQPGMVDAMNIWLSARQRGISRARNEAGNPSEVGVFHAVEVSSVLPYSRSGLTRVINAVVPVVKPDMVSYSSYESSISGDATATKAAMTEALNVIKSLAPDPLGLGDKRIFISEYGLFENEYPAETTTWRTQTILQTSQAAGIFGAFMWQVFDNECRQGNGAYFPIDTSPGDPIRPLNSQCRGLWLVRPDGTLSPVLSLVSPYWKPSTSGMTLTGRITSAANGTAVGGASISFYGGRTAADGNGNYSLPNVPPGPTQLTASASGYQISSINVTVNATQNSPVNFPLVPSSAPGSISGLITNAVSGGPLTGVTVSYSGGSTTSNSSGVFNFTAVPGGTYNVTAQAAGWVPVTTAITVQPGVASVLKLALATGGKLAGQVFNSSGAPVAGATVNLHGGLVPANVSVTTNSSGSYDSGWLAIGSYQAVATASGYGQTALPVTLSTGVTSTQNFTLSAPQPDFSLVVSPIGQTVIAGQTTSYRVQINPVRGFNSSVLLNVTGVPANATVAFNPTSLPSGPSTLTVNTNSTTPVGSYLLTITGTGGGLQRSEQVTLNVIAPPTTGSALGRVTKSADGTPIAGATVSFSNGTATTDQNGNYALADLPIGNVQLTARASGYQDSVQTVAISSGQNTTANFALSSVVQTGSISGQITSALDGRALAGATVSYSGGSAVSNASGNFTFSSVAPGNYQLTATMSGWVPATVSASVTAGAMTIANIKLATGGKLTGQVQTSTGAPVAGASVQLNGGLVATNITVLTSTSGAYDSGWIAVGTYQVTVTASGYAPATASATLTTGVVSTRNFTLSGTAPGTISGRITNALDGSGMAGATVSYSRGSTVSDAGGYYSFNSVPPAAYTVTAQKAGWVSASSSVTVVSGVVSVVNIRLATGGKITGKIVNRSGIAISGVAVRFTGGLVPTNTTVFTNSSGVYASGWISIGSYTIQAAKSGYTTQSKTSSISTGSTVTVNFTLQ
ncbi:MAG: carboxypeptidase regulatory-like domain-containing protein [Acidobacteriia bacterium]|nr:carboxypeptidase regulatory-like domain-containing protein [Terriglobia bacterium]